MTKNNPEHKQEIDELADAQEPDVTDEEVEKAVDMGRYIQGSWKWKGAYALMRLLMFVESAIWTAMDLVRGWRMGVAAKINANYQSGLKHDDPSDRV